MMTDNDFYEQCASYMQTTHEGEAFAWPKRTRWSNRHAPPGRGRFPGRGIIRCFGNQVHIALTNPPLTTICQSKDEALKLLSTM